MRVRLRYVRMDPTGNRTLLVKTSVPAGDRPALAARLMALEPDAEQVGFLSPGLDGSYIALRMAGGEFCGNAAMSAAVFYALENHIPEGTVAVSVSGAERPVAVEFTRLPEGSYRGTVTMPGPLSVRRERPSPGEAPVPLVRFPGIAHAILPGTPDRGEAERLAPLWCRSFGVEALGLMFLDQAAGAMTPLVYVPGADTLCWENSCASGTTAVGAYLAGTEGRPLRLALRQPGGTLEISAGPGGDLRLTGTVRLLGTAEADIEV